MKFYRVEKDSHGPYLTEGKDISLMEFLEKNRGLDYSSDTFDDFLRVCPGPYIDREINLFINDCTGEKIKEYIFGFDTIEKLINWFSQYNQFDFLIDFDYKVRVYETENYCISDFQMIAKDLTFIEELSLDEVI